MSRLLIKSHIVIVCHCLQKHSELFVVWPDNSKEPLFESDYVDPSCEGQEWSRIPSLSKKQVWGENCPIYLSHRGNINFDVDDMTTNPYLYSYGPANLKDILDQSYRVLIKGGQVIFKDVMGNFENARKFPRYDSKYNLDIIDPKDLPIILQKNDSRDEIRHLIVYTKK